MTWHEEYLRRLALNEEGALEAALGASLRGGQCVGLDGKTQALTRLAALIAMDSAPASYQWSVALAHAAGATDEEIVAVLVAVGPIVGAARVNAAAPEVAVAIGEEIQTPRAG
jgi:alkylhydroperoxidase/carboxymuconolactone decarboxylase family protein YurZ